MWESASDFFAMGGYARFIWPVWGIAVVLMVGLFIRTYKTSKAAEAQLASLQEDQN